MEQTALSRPFAHKSAFVLNANARAVSHRLAEQFAEVVPAGDLFFSRTLEDAEVFAKTIARRGYGRVFTGGGDGTLVATVRLLKKAAQQEGVPMPQVGVLTTNLQATKDRFEIGDLTRTDVAQSEARLQLDRSSLATAQARLATSEENYRRVIGHRPDHLAPPPPLPPLPGSAD